MTEAPDENWIAEQIYDCFADDGTASEIRVALGVPWQVLGGTEWRCPVLVDAFGRRQVQQVAGEGSLQALGLALSTLTLLIARLPSEPGYTVTLYEQENLLLGLPKFRYPPSVATPNVQE